MSNMFPVPPRAILLTTDTIPLIMKRCGQTEKFWNEALNEADALHHRRYIVVNYPNSAYYPTWIQVREDYLRERYRFNERLITMKFTKLHSK